MSPDLALEEMGPRRAALRVLAGARALGWLRWATLAAALALVPVVTEGWSQQTFALDLGGQIAIFTIVLLGLTILYGWTGQIALGHAAFIGLGAYTTAIVDRTAGVGFEGGGAILALEELAAAIAVCAVAGVVVGLPAVRISGLQLVIITLGAGQIFLWFLATYYSFTGGDQGLFVSSISIGGLSTTSVMTRYFVAAVAAVLLTALVAQIRRAPVGRSMRAISHSALAAQSVGVHIARTKLLAFVLSSVLAGIGGWLYAHQLSGVAPGYFVMFTSIYLLAAILIGGNGSLAGAWIGATYLILIPELVHSTGGSGNVFTTVSGVLLICVVIFAPRGIADLAGRLRLGATARLARVFDRVVPVSLVQPRILHAIPRQDDAAPATRVADGGNSLDVRDVTVSFNGIDVLHDVSLTFDASVINGILGPNGAGKTTLLNVITGFVKPVHGRVAVGSQVIDSLNPRQRSQLGIGRTFQTPRLLESESVESNILLGRFRLPQASFVGQALASRSHRSHDRRDRLAVEEVAAHLRLSRRDLARRVSILPAGTRRLVELGRVLAMEPAIILLDEPIAGLDAEERATVAEVLLDSQRSSDTLIVVIEHNVDWVRTVCEHLAILDAGSLLVSGAPSDVLELSSVRQAYFGLSDAAPAVR
jgi:ABC-type branched-subunit amino acid transport system ATPase component/ABC-type branched-subunit amino acid transport system permease subunit